jgi:hypothetical protein
MRTTAASISMLIPLCAAVLADGDAVSGRPSKPTALQRWAAVANADRTIKAGMSQDLVRQLLGEPAEVSDIVWKYREEGEVVSARAFVTFKGGKVVKVYSDWGKGRGETMKASTDDAVPIGAEMSDVERTLGRPSRREGADHWVYERYPLYLVLFFSDGKVVKVRLNVSCF